MLTFSLLFCSQLQALSWEDYSVEIVEKKILDTGKEARINAKMKDARGNTFHVHFTEKADKKIIEQALSLKEKFFSWEFVKIDRLTLALYDSSMDIVLIPSRINYKDRDLLPYLPAGLSFSYNEEKIRYNFRILKENQSYKLTGVLDSEESLLDKILFYIKEDKPEEIIKEQKQTGEEQENKSGETVNDIPVKKDGLRHGLRFGFGSGSLFSMGYTLQWRFVELNPWVGFLYYNGKSESVAFPLGLRTHLYFSELSFFRLYWFGGVSYNTEIENYDAPYTLITGLGEVFLKYFFVELGYLYNPNGHGLTLGLGLHIPFLLQ
jgi:hypothetical protein